MEFDSIGNGGVCASDRIRTVSYTHLLQIHAAAGIRNQKIQRLFAHLKAHESPSAVVFPFLCEAVLAGKVAVVRDVQAQRLYNSLPLLEIADILLVNVFRK